MAKSFSLTNCDLLLYSQGEYAFCIHAWAQKAVPTLPGYRNGNKGYPLFKTVSRRDADVEPTWTYLRRVLNNGYPFHPPC